VTATSTRHIIILQLRGPDIHEEDQADDTKDAASKDAIHCTQNHKSREFSSCFVRYTVLFMLTI